VTSPFAVVRGQDLIAAALRPERTRKCDASRQARGSHRPRRQQRRLQRSALDTTRRAHGEKTPGVLVQAQMVAELVDGRQVSELSWHETQALVVGMWAAGCLLSWLASRRGFKFSRWTFGAIFLVAVDVVIFARWRLVLPFTLGMAAWILGVTAGQFITQMKLGSTK
jgi:hypothetical protein